MHILLLLIVTSGLVLLQTTQGVTTNLEPDADFLEEAMADGFIVSTKEPTKTEIPRDNHHAVINHDSLNPEANRSPFQKDSLPTITTVKTPEASTKLSTGNTNELPKNENATVLMKVGSHQTTTLPLEETLEGSGIFPEQIIKKDTSVTHTTLENVDKKDFSSKGSDMISTTLNEEQEGSGSGITNLDWLTTTSTKIKKEGRIAVVYRTKEEEEKHSPDQENKDWLLILALCLTLGAVICVLAGIATKDMWYGPGRKCFNPNSTDSTNNQKYDKAATLRLSEKEMVALMSTQKEERKDCTTISIEDIPEKEYLM
ncbi:uncharacterized protein cd44a isoform X3 [Neoarius graeffei]|uniref:uncharacterized protein cd44a isoform X3 n=1 Tax=Neoarius graeffei TaxID=443677 RepID=UPI00298C3295|nr:uncharacterized protein cd44a isoform X3 [Neoarius graeffei]